jgi:two-component system, NtrC family, sensor kinase
MRLETRVSSMATTTRKLLREPNLTGRIRFWFAAIALIPLTTLAFVMYLTADWALRQEVITRLEALADIQASQFETFTQSCQRDARILAESPLLAETVVRLQEVGEPSLQGKVQDEIRALLLSGFRVLDYADLVIHSSDGKKLFTLVDGDKTANLDVSPPPSETSLSADYSHFVSASDSPHSVFTPLVLNGDPRLLIAAPIRKDEMLVGTLILKMRLDPIHEMVAQHVGLGETGEVIIGARDGSQITFMTSTRHDPQAAFRRTMQLDDKLGYALQRAAVGEDGSGVVVDYRGKETFAAWRFLPSSNWSVAAKIDTREVLAPLDRIRNWGMLLGTIAILFVSVLAWHLAATLSRPIESLTKAARAVGSGSLGGESLSIGTMKLANWPRLLMP